MKGKKFNVSFRGAYLALLLGVTMLVFVADLLAKKPISTSALSGEDLHIYLPLLLDLPCGFTDEQEPNDVFDEANGLPQQNRTYLGCFFDSNDINDIYYFNLPDPSMISVTLRNIPVGHDYDLVLYDENKFPLYLSNNEGNEDEHIVTDQIMASQLYYIQVFNFSETAASQPYELIVNYNITIPCDHPAVIGEVFPQLVNELGAFPFFFGIQCHAVFDNVHSGLLAIRLGYVASSTEGYWGIATPNGFDARAYSEICFWVYAETPLQAFQLHLKDTEDHEFPANQPITINQSEKWIEKCKNLSEYEMQGVILELLENMNVHFSQTTRSATIWVDDFKFK